MPTPRLNLPYIVQSQASKEVTHNSALNTIDLLVQAAVADRDLAAPPGSPAPGDAYIVGPAATGAWAGQDGKLAAWYGTAWVFAGPRAGFIAYVADENVLVIHDGVGWVGLGLALALTIADTAGLQDALDGKVAKAGDTLSGALTVSVPGGNGFLEARGETGANLFTTRYSSDTAAPTFLTSKARGTIAAPAAVLQNDLAGEYRMRAAYNGTPSFRNAVGLRGVVTEPTPSGGNMGTRLEIHVTPVGGTSYSEILRLEHASGLSLFGANPVVDQNRHHRLRAYTVATLPAAAASPQGLIYVSDGTSNKRLAVSDGSNWRWPDGAAVS
ncbi:DUF2793 domain-containing protein [Oleomonas cavernae]|uniref:DUF2793 domain-containing protein n=1 Tax=Oleomonas cavernae TaxID=2320859 RepID=A0A418WTT6_9PROT|nr:DUF2793 domain-containing protein [Oleomonas cavernae]RJF94569.1 DUF2793 domain-containing protein [Oleomonas cavernae]